MKTVINIKTEKETKKRAQKLAEELGLSLSTVVNVQLREFVRNRSLYLSSVPKMTPHLERLIARAEKDFKKGRNISGPFRTAEEAIRHLNSL